MVRPTCMANLLSPYSCALPCLRRAVTEGRGPSRRCSHRNGSGGCGTRDRARPGRQPGALDAHTRATISVSLSGYLLSVYVRMICILIAASASGPREVHRMIDLPTANATPEMRVATPGSRRRGLLTDDSLFTVSLSSFYCETLELGPGRGDKGIGISPRSRASRGSRYGAFYAVQTSTCTAGHDARAVRAPQSSRAPPTRHHRLIRLQLSRCASVGATK